jgi:undecaprenyl-phosphate 4-deoxy-4-formamido-L-arabinose transferase
VNPEPQPDISIVVPVYRSADCLAALVEAIEAATSAAGLVCELVLTDDASPDNSWEVITALARERPWIVGQRHRRNYGQDNGIVSGLRVARGRVAVIMDDDLQHDPRDIPRLIEALEAGPYDVVFADFRKRHHKAWKNLGSWFNGKVAEWLLDKPRDVYLSPFKAVRMDVVREIVHYPGSDPYVDGLLLQVTNRLGKIEATHHPRHAGESGYSFGKSVQVWTRLAFSFSLKPLRIGLWLGILVAALGLLGAGLVVLLRLISGEIFTQGAAGWSSLICAILVFSGVQMFMLSVVGEYIGRIYINLNRLPQPAVAETVNLDQRTRREPA